MLAAADLTVFTEEAAPMNDTENGKVTGSATEIVREIVKRAGTAGEPQVVPWARGYKEVQERGDVALYATTRTEAREPLFHWVGPVGKKPWILYAKKGAGLKIASLDDAKKVKAIGIYKDDAKGQLLRKEGFTNLDEVPKDDVNPKKLIAGRIDPWISGDQEAPPTAKNAGVDPAQFEPVFAISTKELYVVFARKADAALVKSWQDAYAAMDKDGTLAGIVKKWNAVW
jgi:polar amino acid transport system substrate-binding protein